MEELADILAAVMIDDVSEAVNSKRSQLSPKVRKKLGKLHRLKVDPSRILFRECGSIAEGGFATVVRATLLPQGHTTAPDDGVEKQNIAVKKMKITDRRQRNKVLGAALREAELLKSITHENIISLLGLTEDILNDVVWLIFRWAANGNLRDFVASADWKVPERIWLINGVISGLKYLHELQPPICHGDLKSLNILVNSKYRTLITDFGSARRIRHKPATTKVQETEHQDNPQPVLEATVCDSTNTITLTKNNFTLRWAAPEVLNDDDKGVEADIWSFGWVCYEVMTGNIPFEDLKNEVAVTLSIFKGNLPSLDDYERMLLIRRLGSLMANCWRVKPEDRPDAKVCKSAFRWMPKCVPCSEGSNSNAANRAKLLIDMGNTYGAQSDDKRASRCYEEALVLYTEAGVVSGKVTALRKFADMCRTQRELEKAEWLYIECIRTCDDAPHDQDNKILKHQRALGQYGLAEIHRLRGEITKAIGLYLESIQIWDNVGDQRRKAYCLGGLAMAYATLEGKGDESMSLLDESRLADATTES